MPTSPDKSEGTNQRVRFNAETRSIQIRLEPQATSSTIDWDSLARKARVSLDTILHWKDLFGPKRAADMANHNALASHSSDIEEGVDRETARELNLEDSVKQTRALLDKPDAPIVAPPTPEQTEGE